MLKTFKEYLTESKKAYSFKVKVAGELPEGFAADLQKRLSRCNAETIKETHKTPIQKVPMDFPEMTNVEVRVFDVICEYPITAPEIEAELKEMGMDPCCFRIRGAGEPSEIDQQQSLEGPSGESLLLDQTYSEAGKVKSKDYFGDEFNKTFLKDLSKTAKQSMKEEGKGEFKLPKAKQDKAGVKSAMGS